MQTEELLTGVYGELHELLGDHREFKRETLARLASLERDMKEAPGTRAAKLCAFVSALSGLASLLGSLGLRLAAMTTVPVAAGSTGLGSAIAERLAVAAVAAATAAAGGAA